MRITSSMYYNNIDADRSKLNPQLFDVNKQISSGKKIQYAYEGTQTFVDTLRLDSEITTLEQVGRSSDSGLKFSNQTDTTLNEFSITLDTFRTKLIQAANDTLSYRERQAIGHDLESLRGHLVNLANTSINGQYLFAGTDLTVKPVNDDGTYNGNDGDMFSFGGSNVKQKYNISGTELFFGEESQTKRTITTNIKTPSLTALYIDPTDPTVTGPVNYITSSDTIRDLMGDTDLVAGNEPQSVFYIRGVDSSGESFKQKIAMDSSQSVGELMTQIGNLYGNTPTNKVVNVTLNDEGQIVIEDKVAGSSKLDFHMVAAIDFTAAAGTSGAADVGVIDNLVGAATTTDFKDIITGPETLYVKEFIRSDLTSAPAATTVQGVVYERTAFEQNGSQLTSNVSQIVKSDNSFAVDSTRIGAVASGTTYDPVLDRFSGLNGQVLTMSGDDINGNPYNATINLLDGGSTFTVNATTYNIEDATGAATDAGKVTYRQLMDVINMIVTDTPPGSVAITAPATTAYQAAVMGAEALGQTSLSNEGKIAFEQQNVPTTSASIALYDTSTDTFAAAGVIQTGSTMNFNANNALTIRDAKTNFFARLDETINAVMKAELYPDGENTDPRSVGIESAIQVIDDLLEHTGNQHVKSGAQSNALILVTERTEMLVVSASMLRSEVLDTDIAEASMRLQQLNLNMQALLSTVSRVSQLSLVNYL